MCGLIGVAGAIDDKVKALFKDMLVFDTVRGPHSTGVMSKSAYNDTIDVMKSVGNPYELFDRKSFDAGMLGMKSVLLGHNRYATKGKINRQNAHPFEFDSVCGAHNGTLRNQALLDDHAQFEVDSENIYHHMGVNGVEDTIKKLNGAYALTWYDKYEDTINFCRNNERPLKYAFTKDRRTLLWASEGWMIVAAAMRNNIETTEIVNVEVDRHYKFKLPPYHYNIKQPFVDITITPVAPWKAPVTVIKPRTTTTTTTSAGKHGAPNGNKLYETYAEYLGEVIEFVIAGPMTSVAGAEYLGATLLDGDAEIDIRLFTDKTSELHTELMESTEAWQGLAKKFTASEGGYLVVDLRTLLEIPGLVDELNEQAYKDSVDNIAGFNNKRLSEAEFKRLTSRGCCWCSDPIRPEQHQEIKWIDYDECLCSTCQHDPAVTEYYNTVSK